MEAELDISMADNKSNKCLLSLLAHYLVRSRMTRCTWLRSWICNKRCQLIERWPNNTPRTSSPLDARRRALTWDLRSLAEHIFCQQGRNITCYQPDQSLLHSLMTTNERAATTICKSPSVGDVRTTTMLAFNTSGSTLLLN